MYRIEVDREHGVVFTTLAGMMDTAEAAAYIAELKRTFIANRLHHYAMVIDVTDCPIQRQETVRAMGEHMASMPRARVLAIVTGGSLARMQIRRLFTRPYARICADLDEGRAGVYDGLASVTPWGSHHS